MPAPVRITTDRASRSHAAMVSRASVVGSAGTRAEGTQAA
jgi:hypothetical protein